MNVIDKIKRFFNEEDEMPRVIADSDFCRYYKKLWQYNHAQNVVADKLGAILANSEWRTYRNNKKVTKNDYFKLNVAFNDTETAAETWKKIAWHLVHCGECLIVQMTDERLFVADEFQFKNGKKFYLQPNQFTHVKIGDSELRRSFTQGKTAIYISLPYSAERDGVYAEMQQAVGKILSLTEKGANKALGMKLNLAINGQNKNAYTKEAIDTILSTYTRNLESTDAIFITYNGEVLNDLTEKQRGSEVQQVIELMNNNIKASDEVIDKVANAYGFPPSFIKGAFTEDSGDLYSMALTFGAKPITNTIAQAMTLFFCETENIMKGCFIKADLEKVRFVDSLGKASAIDKLIGCGVFTINEVRENLGADGVEGGDKRYITKNYAAWDDTEDNGKGVNGEDENEHDDELLERRKESAH